MQLKSEIRGRGNTKTEMKCQETNISLHQNLSTKRSHVAFAGILSNCNNNFLSSFQALPIETGHVGRPRYLICHEQLQYLLFIDINQLTLQGLYLYLEARTFTRVRYLR